MVKWSIDASFAVHGDMRSHTGGCGTLANHAAVCGKPPHVPPLPARWPMVAPIWLQPFLYQQQQQ
jgi:hypothetical protein